MDCNPCLAKVNRVEFEKGTYRTFIDIFQCEDVDTVKYHKQKLKFHYVKYQFVFHFEISLFYRGRHDCDHMVVGLTITCAISAIHH